LEIFDDDNNNNNNIEFNNCNTSNKRPKLDIPLAEPRIINIADNLDDRSICGSTTGDEYSDSSEKIKLDVKNSIRSMYTQAVTLSSSIEESIDSPSQLQLRVFCENSNVDSRVEIVDSCSTISTSTSTSTDEKTSSKTMVTKHNHHKIVLYKPERTSPNHSRPYIKPIIPRPKNTPIVPNHSSFSSSWVIKRDLRQLIPQMFANVHNGHDFTLLKSFFEEFCTPGCRFVAEYPHAEKFNAPRIRRSKNRDELVAHVLYDVGIFPDIMFQVLSTKIIQRKGYVGSQLVFDLLMKGTAIHRHKESVDSIHKKPVLCIHQKNQLMIDQLVSTMSISSLNQGKDDDDQSHHTTGYQQKPPLVIDECILCKAIEKPLLMTPVQVVSKNSIIFYLDEFHQIYCYEMVAH